MEMNPSFFIGKLPVYGELILAPMDGFSTYPFRSITRDLGSSVSYSEFISASDVIHPSPKLENHLYFENSERPLVYQLLDHDTDRLVKAAQKLTLRSPDIIDINFGCPSRQVTAHGAGAALLKEPEKVSQIISELVRVLPIPVTAKIRLGWDAQSRNYLEIAHRIEDSGAALIAVHGRTRRQGYTGSVDLDAIAEVKSTVKIPVIANGNICCVEDIARMKEHTHCDGVMIGRHAIENPWIFSYRNRSDVSPGEAANFLQDLLARMVTLYKLPIGVFRFRTYLVDITKPHQFSLGLKEKLLSSQDPIELSFLLEEWAEFNRQFSQTEQ